MGGMNGALRRCVVGGFGYALGTSHTKVGGNAIVRIAASLTDYSTRGVTSTYRTGFNGGSHSTSRPDC